MSVANKVVSRLDAPYLVPRATLAHAKEVARWLSAVKAGRLDNLVEVLNEYIGRIELRPVATIHRGRMILQPTMLRANALQLAAAGTALLIDKKAEWHGRFGRCAVCHRFFFDARKGRGPKRWRVCSQKCRDREKYLRRKIRAAA
jgi:hypothetical protein